MSGDSGTGGRQRTVIYDNKGKQEQEALQQGVENFDQILCLIRRTSIYGVG